MDGVMDCDGYVMAGILTGEGCDGCDGLFENYFGKVINQAENAHPTK
jgi:hypothetical protein